MELRSFYNSGPGRMEERRLLIEIERKPFQAGVPAAFGDGALARGLLAISGRPHFGRVGAPSSTLGSNVFNAKGRWIRCFAGQKEPPVAQRQGTEGLSLGGADENSEIRLYRRAMDRQLSRIIDPETVCAPLPFVLFHSLIQATLRFAVNALTPSDRTKRICDSGEASQEAAPVRNKGAVALT